MILAKANKSDVLGQKTYTAETVKNTLLVEVLEAEGKTKEEITEALACEPNAINTYKKTAKELYPWLKPAEHLEVFRANRLRMLETLEELTLNYMEKMLLENRVSEKYVKGFYDVLSKNRRLEQGLSTENKAIHYSNKTNQQDITALLPKE